MTTGSKPRTLRRYLTAKVQTPAKDQPEHTGKYAPRNTEMAAKIGKVVEWVVKVLEAGFVLTLSWVIAHYRGQITRQTLSRHLRAACILSRKMLRPPLSLALSDVEEFKYVYPVEDDAKFKPRFTLIPRAPKVAEDDSMEVVMDDE